MGPRLWTRRRHERQAAGWLAKYRLEDDAAHEWALCRVLDVSPAGAALEIAGVMPETGRIVLEVQSVEVESTGVQLYGQIRNTRPRESGIVIVGVEFVDMTPLERSLLAMLLELQSA